MAVGTMIDDLPTKHFGAILADPPWSFNTWSDKGKGRSAERHYPTMTDTQIADLPVDVWAAKDCVLFMWTTWPKLQFALQVMNLWCFTYKTCGFCWTKAVNPYTLDQKLSIGTGYWTRANTEVCLLGTTGKPKRIHNDVEQAILAPRREHSRKPPCIHQRIERLVEGPYLELFAREPHEGWTVWGNETEKFSK